MFIHYPFEDFIEVDESKYQIDASFDNVLRVMDLISDERVNPKLKIDTALLMLTEDKFEDYEAEQKARILEAILKKYVSVKTKEVRDLQGNIMPTVEEEAFFDYSEDADLIYSAFMQSYGVDLIDQQGKLHWLKFRALLSGLPENTKLVNVIGIRSWKPSDDKRSRNEVMLEAQRKHRLKGVKTMSDGNVRIQVISSDQEAQKTLDLLKSIHQETQNISKNTSNNAFKGLGDSAEKSGSKIGDMTKAIIGSQGVVMALGVLKDSIGSAFQRFDTLQRYPKMMEKMGFSAEQSERSMRKLSKGIEGLPTRLDEVVGTAQGLAVMTGDINEATNLTLALNNAFLASGSSSADASRGLVQYQQMLSAGKVDMQSWKTLQETMPFALQQTAEAFGFAGSSAKKNFYEALKQGDITFDQFNQKLMELDGGVGGFAEMAKEGSKGVQTSMQNMKTAVVNGVAKTIEQFDKLLVNVTGKNIADNLDGGKEVIKGFFRAFNNSISAVMPLLEILGKGTLDLLKIILKLLPAIEALAVGFLVFKTITWLVTTFQSIGFVLSLLKAYFYYAQLSATAFFTTLKGFVLANPITAGIVALSAAVYGMYKVLNRTTPEVEELGDKMKETAEKAKTLTDGIAEENELFDSQKAKIKASADGMRSLAKSMGDLSSRTDRSAGDTKKLKDQMIEMNKYIGEGTVQYDARSKKINLSTQELEGYIAVAEKKKELEATRDRMNKLAERQLELDLQKKENIEQLKQAQAELNELAWHQWGDKKVLEERVKDLQTANQQIIASETAVHEQKRVLTDEQKLMYDELAEAEKGLTSVKLEENNKRITAIEQLDEHEKKAVEGMRAKYEEIATVAGNMFDRINTKSEISANEMLKNLKANQKALEEWANNLEILSKKGLDEGILEELRKLGPQGAGAVAELAKQSEPKLQEFNAVFEKGGKTAINSFTKAWGIESSTIGDDIMTLVTQADESLSDQISHTNFANRGKDIVDGVAKGIDENKQKAADSAKQMATKVQELFSQELGIQSPSKVFAENGNNIVLGLIQGIVRASAQALDSVRQLSREMVNVSSSTIQGGTPKMYDAGKFMGAGFANGLASKRKAILGVARSIALAVAETMRLALRIKSPSRVATEIGEYTGEGLEVGLENKINDVKRISDLLAMSAVPDVNTKQVYEMAVKSGNNTSTTNSTVFNVDKIIWQGKEDIRKTMEEMGWIAGQEKWRLQTT